MKSALNDVISRGFYRPLASVISTIAFFISLLVLILLPLYGNSFYTILSYDVFLTHPGAINPALSNNPSLMHFLYYSFIVALCLILVSCAATFIFSIFNKTAKLSYIFMCLTLFFIIVVQIYEIISLSATNFAAYEGSLLDIAFRRLIFYEPFFYFVNVIFLVGVFLPPFYAALEGINKSKKIVSILLTYLIALVCLSLLYCIDIYSYVSVFSYDNIDSTRLAGYYGVLSNFSLLMLTILSYAFIPIDRLKVKLSILISVTLVISIPLIIYFASVLMSSLAGIPATIFVGTLLFGEIIIIPLLPLAIALYIKSYGGLI